MPRTSAKRGFSESLLAAVLAMAVAIALAVGLGGDVRGALIGEYDLKTGSFANAVPSSPITGNMTGHVSGGTGNFTASGWTWSGANTTPGSGLMLQGLATGNSTFNSYTIAVEFDFGQVSSYRRLMWLKPNDDRGLYVNTGRFEIVGYSPPGNFSGNITANTKTNFVVTRTGTGNVTAYQVLNPESPTPTANQLFTFTDTSNILVSSNGTMEFFRDDATGTDFSSSGNASLIKIWNAPLTSEEVKFAFVPEPATIALLAVAGGGAMLYLHRCRRSRR